MLFNSIQFMLFLPLVLLADGFLSRMRSYMCCRTG